MQTKDSYLMLELSRYSNHVLKLMPPSLKESDSFANPISSNLTLNSALSISLNDDSFKYILGAHHPEKTGPQSQLNENRDDEYEDKDNFRPKSNFGEPLEQNPPQNERKETDVLESDPLTLISVNKSTKYRIYRDAEPVALKYNSKAAAFVTEMAEKIREVHGKTNYDLGLDSIHCTLNDDFSYRLRLTVKGSQEQEEYRLGGLNSADDAFHNIRDNIRNKLTRKKFLDKNQVDTATREALKELQITAGGETKLKDGFVDCIWSLIEEDHRLVTNFYESKIDDGLLDYFQSTFKRTENSLKTSLKKVKTRDELENLKLAGNLPARVQEVFKSYVKGLKSSDFGPKVDEVSPKLKERIAGHVTSKVEGPQLIWLMGCRESIKQQVLENIKFKLVKLRQFGEKKVKKGQE